MSISRIPPPVSNSNIHGLSDATYSQAGAAERDANFRIATAGKQVEAAQLQVNESLNEIRDAYEKQATNESARNEMAIENQKLKGYEQVRDLQRAQQAELRRLRRDGERDQTVLGEHYRNATYAAERDAREQLTAIEKQGTHQIEYTQKSQESELEDRRSQHEQQMAQLRQTSDEQLQKLTDSSRKEFEDMREGYGEATERTQESFNTQLQNINTEATKTLSRIQENADHQLRHVREDTSFKLSAYGSRQKDPFYKLVDIHARLHDAGDSYVLTATVPEYEQQHVSVAVKGNNLVITGNRRNEEAVERESGHFVGSASFQSFHESFPLPWPVDSERLSKEFNGDEVIVRVPKKNEFAFKLPEPKVPNKVRAEAPHFPENIRHAKPEASKGSDDDNDGSPAKPVRKEKGSGTLS